VLPPITDAVIAIEPGTEQVHEQQAHGSGNVLRHVHVERGAQNATAPIVVHGEYEVGMQDQAFLGPESGSRCRLMMAASSSTSRRQWLHADQRQVAAALDLPDEKVRFTLAGVGGAFGGREDVSMQAHACLLALRTSRPVKMVYSREESFYGHVHRHPRCCANEHGARPRRTADLRSRRDRAGRRRPTASSSTAVAANAASWVRALRGRQRHDGQPGRVHEQPAVRSDARIRAVQAASPTSRRWIASPTPAASTGRAAGAPTRCTRVGDADRTGGRLGGPGGRAACAGCKPRPLPPPLDASDVRNLPGGASNATHGESVRRGIGYGIGIKNVGFSRGSTTRPPRGCASSW